MSRLERRLATLRELAEVAPGRVPADVLARVEATGRRASGRLAHGTTRTVAALAGATGSGKSSIFNAIADSPLASTGVRRPTTSRTQAVVFAADGAIDADAASLLDWLDVADRNVVADRGLDGLILLDLPDHDSTALDHRQEVDRLVNVVDVFVWIVDPQKYADGALHRDYLQRFAGHADVTLVVLNQLDNIAETDRAATIDDLARLVRDDGLAVARPGLVGRFTGRSTGVRVLGASALTGEGIGELRGELAARAAERRAIVTRLEADIDWIASDVTAAIGDRAPGVIAPRSAGELGDALAGAVGADAIADAVASSHERAGRAAVGWPLTSWIARLRPDPLRRLGLRRQDRPDDPSTVDRTSLPPASPVAAAAVSGAIRALADRAGESLPEPWRRRISDAAGSRRADLDDALDRAVASADLRTVEPRWWRLVGLVQFGLVAAMIVGLAWLAAIAVVSWLQLPDLPYPELGAVPWPTVLAVGGALAGVVVGAVARWVNRATARRRAAEARRAIAQAAQSVADDLVVAPIAAELANLARVRTLATELRR